MKRKSLELPVESSSINKSSNDKKLKVDDVNKSIDLNQIDSLNRLKNDFFDEDCLTLSKKLLGKYLIRKIVSDDSDKFDLMIGKIVEVEAYLGGSDKASHSYNNKSTERNKAMFMKAGTAYVYNIYGCYCCLNISSKEPGAGVLIRALEPISGIDIMAKYRKLENTTLKKQIRNLTNGPSKLCISMNITKNLFNQVDFATCESLWLQDKLNLNNSNDLNTQEQAKFNIISAKRINIDYAGEEWINKLYRFYIKDNSYVSVKSKEPVQIDY